MTAGYPDSYGTVLQTDFVSEACFANIEVVIATRVRESQLGW